MNKKDSNGISKLKEDLSIINNRFDKLEEKINNFIDNFESRESGISNKSNHKELLHIKDIEELYHSENFEAFYEKCREYEYKVDEGIYAEDVGDGETFFSRLFLCLAYFDIDKIAKQITYINKNETDKDCVLKSADVTDITSITQWKQCLLNCLKQIVENIVKYGEADEDHTFRDYQIGRIHLNSIYVTWKGESTNALSIYWTDDHWNSAPDSW